MDANISSGASLTQVISWAFRSSSASRVETHSRGRDVIGQEI